MTIRALKLGSMVAALALPAFRAGIVRADHPMHMVDGVTNTVINLTAEEGHISTADGSSVYIWGLAYETNAVQYPAASPNVLAVAAVDSTGNPAIAGNGNF